MSARVEAELDIISAISILYGFCQEQMDSFSQKVCYVASSFS